MKCCKTMKEVMHKHRMSIKEFSQLSKMPLKTCYNMSAGQSTPTRDIFAPLLDWAIQHGYKGVDDE